MDAFQVYKDMKARTNGEIYIGVVGPGRTGKSTFINTICQQEIVSLKEMNQNIARPENAHLDPGIQLNHLTVGMFL